MAKKILTKDFAEINEVIDGIFPRRLPVLPLRDTIIFPNMIFPVLIGRVQSMAAVSQALERDKIIFVDIQKKPEVEDPKFNDLYKVGVVAKIVQVLRLPNNLFKVLLEGMFPGKIKKTYKNSVFLEAEIADIEVFFDKSDKELQVLVRYLGDLFKQYITKERTLPNDTILAYESIQDPLHKFYFAAANVRAKLEDKQQLLEGSDLNKQFFQLTTLINTELDLLSIEDEIDTKVNIAIQKNQKKYYVQEQIRTLQQELDEEDGGQSEITELKEKIEKAQLPPHALEKANEELEKLRKTPNMSPDFSVNRTYLEMLVSLPWHLRTDDVLNINHVKQILDDDHYDLEKPKDRILEYIAILNFTGQLRRQILCFVGPPGVGKTSLAKSIARALGRKFIRISLGGVRDEAEIRGHRRTYIGALPGKIIQSMKKAGTVNPVILLDEIDKMSTDFRGDPSSALLEVLDPEQNISFNDHYLEIDYDLSNVLFITTANVRYDIPLPLLDRMEIIELNSYLENDKLQIAKRHILPKILEEFGMDHINIVFSDAGLLKIIRQYTRESGVRNLEREIASVLRKLAKDLLSQFTALEPIALETADAQTISTETAVPLPQNPKFVKFIGKKDRVIDDIAVEKYLAAPRFKEKKDKLDDKIGVATGLAWTSTGGDILPIEVSIMPAATEKLTLTGKLGDVMKESAQAALSFIRSNYQLFSLDEKFSQAKEIHVHVPEGAIPKDGPSAGITMTMAIISAASGRAIRGDLAMTGEVTLRGNVLAIGGLKEKLLAAKRIGITTIVIPKENERDIEDFPKDILDGLDIHPVSTIYEAIPFVFRQ